MIIKPGRSSSYIATIKMDDPADLKFLEETRMKVRHYNEITKVAKRDRWHFTKWTSHYGNVRVEPPVLRVAVKGRKAKTKHSYTDRYGKEHTVGYNWGGDVIGGLTNASEADIYIYRR